MPRAPKCPFYRIARNERVVCMANPEEEEDGPRLDLTFSTASSRLRYWVRHCCGDWQSCSIAQALWADCEKNEQGRG